MATSSIFYNFTITDEKAAERFVDALDKAAQQPPWKSKLGYKPPVRDAKTLQAMMAKRNEKHE